MGVGLIIVLVIVVLLACAAFPAFFEWSAKLDKKYWDKRDKLGY